MPLSATVKLLHALLRDTDQITVMPMRIVGMPLNMGANRLNPCISILGQFNPVAFIHGALQR
jgi:hypothetical protein